MIDSSVFQVSLKDHQKRGVLWASRQNKGFIIMRAGRGKTYVVAGILKVHAKLQGLRCALIVAGPRGVEAYTKLARVLGIPFQVVTPQWLVDKHDSCGPLEGLFVMSVQSLQDWMGRFLSEGTPSKRGRKTRVATDNETVGKVGPKKPATEAKEASSVLLKQPPVNGVRGSQEASGPRNLQVVENKSTQTIQNRHGVREEDHGSSESEGLEGVYGWHPTTSYKDEDGKDSNDRHSSNSNSSNDSYDYDDTPLLSNNSLDRVLGIKGGMGGEDFPFPEPLSLEDDTVPFNQNAPEPKGLVDVPAWKFEPYGAKLLSLLNPDVVIVDEVHDYRVFSSAKTKSLRAVLKAHRGRVFALTATMFYSKVEDVYTLCDLIVPGLFPSYQNFRSSFLITEKREVNIPMYRRTPHGLIRTNNVRVIEEVKGYKNTELLMQAIQSVSYIDLESEFNVATVPVPYLFDPSGPSMDAYRIATEGAGLAELWRVRYVPYGSQIVAKFVMRGRETAMVVLSNGNLKETPPRALVKGHRIALPEGEWGEVVSVDQRVTEADAVARLVPMMRTLSTSPEKLQAMVSLLKSKPTEGFLIFCSLKDTMAHVAELLRSTFGNDRVLTITGGETKMAKKLESIKPDTYVVITQVALQSLDFYLKNLLIYEPVTNPGRLQQLMGRITRENATHRDVTVYSLYMPGGVDLYFLLRLEVLLAQDPTQDSTVGYKQILQEVPGIESDPLGVLKSFTLWVSQ